VTKKDDISEELPACTTEQQKEEKMQRNINKCKLFTAVAF